MHVCTTCNQKFTRSDNLKRHEGSVHVNPYSSVTPPTQLTTTTPPPPPPPPPPEDVNSHREQGHIFLSPATVSDLGCTGCSVSSRKMNPNHEPCVLVPRECLEEMKKQEVDFTSGNPKARQILDILSK